MKIAFFSDIHGNLPALEIAVKKSGKVDGYYILGDVVNYGPWSNECVQMLETLPNCIKILGNHEDYFINDILNVGDDNEITILELAQLVIELVGNKVNIVHKPALKEGDMMRRKPDITKMKSVIGHDLVSLREGIQRVYLDFKKNEKIK